MDELKKGIEWDGRKMRLTKDGGIEITLNREDCLEATVQMWSEFLLGGKEPKDFGKWLDVELKKERAKRLRVESEKIKDAH